MSSILFIPTVFAAFGLALALLGRNANAHVKATGFLSLVWLLTMAVYAPCYALGWVS